MFTRKRKAEDEKLDREETTPEGSVPPPADEGVENRDTLAAATDVEDAPDPGDGELESKGAGDGEDRAIDAYRRRLFDALVAADGRVRDVSAVEYTPELVDDPDALAAKITSVIESRPEVGRNAAFGDVGAGESGDAPAPDLIDVIRAAHDAAY